MNGNAPFDPQEDAPLLSAYVDGELGPEDAARVEAHLARDPEARRLVEQLRGLKTVTGAMRLKEPGPEGWEDFWKSFYNRGERSLGLILLLIGAVLVGGWGAFAAAAAVWSADGLPLFVKIGLTAVGGGLAVLLVSVARERWHARCRTRYKDVVR